MSYVSGVLSGELGIAADGNDIGIIQDDNLHFGHFKHFFVLLSSRISILTVPGWAQPEIDQILNAGD
jgi:hypothetical protein